MIWRRDLVTDDVADWVTDRFGWLITTLGPRAFFDNTRLVLPTRGFFRTTAARDAGTAGEIFDEVRGHMGIEHWPCRLTPRGPIGSFARRVKVPRSTIAGSFYQPDADRPAVITYDARLMHHPRAFIGTLAHELSHYILAPHAADAPGGEDEHEMLTDLAVIYAGFGVIDLQGARDIGWKGYIDADARAYALATFLRLKRIDPEVATAFLDARLARKLHRALVQRDARADELVILDALRSR